METLDGKREGVLADLRANIIRQDFIPADGSPAMGIVEERQVPLPAYVPYIGIAYFRASVRVLCYALNQNLSQHTRWTNDWVSRWASNVELSLDRLNAAVAAGQALPIRPYAEGFIPLAAAMALRHAGLSLDRIGQPLDELIAVTNFVKFSTSEDAASTSIPNSWWKECAAKFVSLELELLQPHIVIGFGQRTVKELGDLLRNGAAEPRPQLLACRFPGRIPSIKARKLSRAETLLWQNHIRPLADKLKLPPAESYHRWRMLRFPGYFCDTARDWGIVWEPS
jgi:hypothetical protein